jgi:general secretion pathway protein M
MAMILVLVAVGAVYFLVAAPLFDLYAGRQAILEQRRMLALRLAAIASELPALRARVAELRAEPSTSLAGFEGDSDAIASANLQSRVEELASSVGAAIGSSENLPAEPRGAYRRIGIRVRLNDNYPTVVKLLGALETATPPLVTSDLHIRGTISRVYDSESLRLDTVFDVYGFRNGDQPPAPAQPLGGSAPTAGTTLAAPTPQAAARVAMPAPATPLTGPTPAATRAPAAPTPEAAPTVPTPTSATPVTGPTPAATTAPAGPTPDAAATVAPPAPAAPLPGPAPTATTPPATPTREAALTVATPPPETPTPTTTTPPAAPTPEPAASVAPPGPAAAPAQSRLSAVEIAALLARGDALLGTGDVVSARLFYERAADAGEGQAAVRLGKTFDPVFLVYAHQRGVRSDLGMALFWYRRAGDLGASEAEILLKRLEPK